MSDAIKTPTSADAPHRAEVGLDPAAAVPSIAAAAERTQTPGEYVGEAENRESDLLARHIESKLVTPRPDCMIWSGATDRGYGRIFLDGTAKRVHRVVWELECGPIPEGLTIDHLCRVRACCNTSHMELVTLAENVRRATPYRPELRRASTYSQATHCRNGHEYTPETTSRKRDGSRRCLICRREQKRRARAKMRAREAA